MNKEKGFFTHFLGNLAFGWWKDFRESIDENWEQARAVVAGIVMFLYCLLGILGIIISSLEVSGWFNFLFIPFVYVAVMAGKTLVERGIWE